MKKFFIRLLHTVRKTYQFFDSADMSVYAANASFFLEIAAFPLIILLLSIVRFFPILSSEQIRIFLLKLFPDVPAISDTISGIALDLEQNTSATVSWISALVTLFSASTGVFAILKGLWTLHGYPKNGKAVRYRLIAIAYTVVILMLAILAVGTDFTANVALRLIYSNPYLSFLTKFTDHIVRVLKYFQIITLTGSFLVVTSLYMFPFERKARIRDQIPGALFTSLCWMLASKIFSFYINYFWKSSVIYGSLTAVILISFWVYLLMSILFLGAALNRALEEQRIPDFLDKFLKSLPKVK